VIKIVAGIAAVWLVWSGMNVAVAKAKNRDPGLCLLCSIFFSPLTVFFYLLAVPPLGEARPSRLFGKRAVFVPTGTTASPHERRAHPEHGASPDASEWQDEGTGYTAEEAERSYEVTEGFRGEAGDDDYVPAEYHPEPSRGRRFFGDIWYLAPTAVKIGVAIAAVALLSVFGVRHAAEIDAFLLTPRKSEYSIHTAIRQYNATKRGSALRNVKRFVVRGQLEAKDVGGFTPLHTAAIEGNTEIIALLIENGADKNALCDSYMTPLHWAAREGNVEAVRFLVECGVSVDSPGFMGETPLLTAAKSGKMETVKELMTLRAETESVNAAGQNIVQAFQGYLSTMSKLGALTTGEYQTRENILRYIKQTRWLSGWRRR